MSMILNLKSATDSEIENLKRNPDSIEGFLYDDEDTDHDQMDLDKAWHGLHFLLTGETDGGAVPLCYLMNAEQLGAKDFGYGPPRALTSKQLAAFEEAIAKIDEKELRKRFDPDAMTTRQIYPSIWDEGDDAFQYLYEHFKYLQEYLTSAKNRKDGTLIWLS
ncbi:MAG TPA: YfbM family protein [Drouetiella sp.]